MKRCRFTEEQIISILKEQEAGLKVPDLCSKHVISDATFHKWKTRYSGLEVSEAKRLKALEDENSRLKHLWLMRCWIMQHQRKSLEENGDACRQAAAGRPYSWCSGPERTPCLCACLPCCAVYFDQGRRCVLRQRLR
ncbi:transposase [Acetobacter cerevisiae]|uniref:transposase n=1 Tax=Acetobacter cerevisiae TaxID=178900 RepID=UPI0035716CB5